MQAEHTKFIIKKGGKNEQTRKTKWLQTEEDLREDRFPLGYNKLQENKAHSLSFLCGSLKEERNISGAHTYPATHRLLLLQNAHSFPSFSPWLEKMRNGNDDGDHHQREFWCSRVTCWLFPRAFQSFWRNATCFKVKWSGGVYKQLFLVSPSLVFSLKLCLIPSRITDFSGDTITHSVCNHSETKRQNCPSICLFLGGYQSDPSQTIWIKRKWLWLFMCAYATSLHLYQFKKVHLLFCSDWSRADKIFKREEQGHCLYCTA